MSNELDVRININILLEAAYRLNSYGKTPFALTLLQIVLEQYPDQPRARMLYKEITGMSTSGQSENQIFRLKYDAETGTFFVEKKGNKDLISFQTLEAAERHLQTVTSKLAGDSSTDAPLPVGDVKKKRKGK